MTQDRAEQVANVLLAVAAVGVVVVVLRTPPLRRLALGLAATALTSTLPQWIAREVGHAWATSGRREL